MSPKLGVLQLVTTFPRPIGDVGHPDTWGDIPVVISQVRGADSKTVVGGTWGEELCKAFVDEGKRLMQEEGCVALVTSCGFLATMHERLARDLPFIGTSALIQVSWLQRSFAKPNSVGIITFKASALTSKHLESMGAALDTPIVGMPEGDEGVFRAVLEERRPYDWKGMKGEMLAAADKLLEQNPTIQAIVLECTNMPPFSRAVAEHTGRRVWDIVTLGKWLYQGAVPPSYGR